MKRKVTIADDVLEEFGRGVRRWRHESPGFDVPSVFTMDPGSGGTHLFGWSLIDDAGVNISGEGTPDAVIAEAGAAIDVVGRIVFAAREAPFTHTRESMEKDETITPATLYKMGIAAGKVHGGLDHGAGVGRPRRFAGTLWWFPMPSTWRAWLGLNRKKTDTMTAREATAEAVWLWASATTGLPLVTKDGRRRIDQANAIGISHALRSLIQEAEVLTS